MKFHVPDMSCGHCTATITQSVKAKDPSAHVEADLETHTVSVTTTSSEADVLGAIKAAGYESTRILGFGSDRVGESTDLAIW